MNKSDLDKFVTEEWEYINTRASTWIKTSKLECDMDIINYAYIECLKSVENDKIDSYSELRQYYFQFLRTATIWRNCKYHRDAGHQTGGKWTTQIVESPEDSNYNTISELLMDQSYETFGESDEVSDIYSDINILNKLDHMFEDSNPTRDESIIWEIMKSGHFTSGKFSNHTKIPRSTSWKLLRKVKEKVYSLFLELKKEY